MSFCSFFENYCFFLGGGEYFDHFVYIRPGQRERNHIGLCILGIKLYRPDQTGTIVICYYYYRDVYFKCIFLNGVFFLLVLHNICFRNIRYSPDQNKNKNNLCMDNYSFVGYTCSIFI